MQLRHALIPYIYTMAWRNTTVGIPLVTPLYYSHPEVDDAYACPQEYWFGSELIAAPVYGAGGGGRGAEPAAGVAAGGRVVGPVLGRAA